MLSAHGFKATQKARLFGGAIEGAAYKHEARGARHYHFVSESREHGFIVAFRTLPNDSSGVAHVLEHLTLAGSRKFQLRSPFFAMNGRSLNTYKNAFTSADYTAFAFATTNQVDFFNLLEVVLDLTFFPTLDQADFEREAWRTEVHPNGKGGFKTTYNGVVLNEMSSKLTNVDAFLWMSLCAELFRTSAYHHYSGGLPEQIVRLSLADVRHFHQTFYHPDNAIFLSFGKIAASAVHERIAKDVMSYYDSRPQQSPVVIDAEERRAIPTQTQASFPASGQKDQPSHFVMAWLLNEASVVEERLMAMLVKGLLLDHSESPLKKYLETTTLAESLSTINGLQRTYKEMVLICGVKGVDARHAAKLEGEILAKIEEAANGGIRQDEINAVLHKMEIDQREVGGDQTPYAIQILLKALLPAVHRHDVLDNIDGSVALDRLRA